MIGGPLTSGPEADEPATDEPATDEPEAEEPAIEDPATEDRATNGTRTAGATTSEPVAPRHSEALGRGEPGSFEGGVRAGRSAPERYAELNAEIAAEAERLRGEGGIPVDLERRLDESFARLLQHRSRGDHLSRSLLEVAATARMHADPGIAEASSPAKRLVKRVLAKPVGWYIARVVEQVNRYARATTASLDLLAERVEGLAEELSSLHPPLPGHVGFGPSTPRSIPLLEADHEIAAEAVAVLRAAPGRVLVAECGSGSSVRTLREAGIDAYGVDAGWRPSEGAASRLDIVEDDPIDHLRDLPRACLGGLVLTGLVDRVDTATARLVSYLGATRVAPGGCVVIAGRPPGSSGASVSVVEEDLAPGRRLHPETWVYLLGEQGVRAEALLSRAGQPAGDDRAGSEEVASGYLVVGSVAR